MKKICVYIRSALFRESSFANPLTYSLKFICNHEVNTILVIQDIHKVTNLSCLKHTFPAEVEQGNKCTILPFCFGFHTVKKCPFHSLFCASFLCFVSMILLLKMVFKHSAEVLTCVPKHKKAVLYLMEKIHVFGYRHSGIS